MSCRIGIVAAAALVAVAAVTVRAQSPAPAPQTSTTTSPPADEHVVANPSYVALHLEISVNRPAAEVWKRVGNYCDIGEWFQVAAGCKILSGTDNEVGAVRSIANEVLVGKTELSYTYTQPVRAGRPYTLYHGTLEARPVTATTSKLLYTLMWDNSTLTDDAAREKDKASRTATFTRALQNMKTLAEGGTIAPR
jgi:hypothetical protein